LAKKTQLKYVFFGLTLDLFKKIINTVLLIKQQLPVFNVNIFSRKKKLL